MSPRSTGHGQHAALIQNRSITRRSRTKTAYELLYNKVPSVAKMKVFGCMAQVFVPADLRKRKAGNKLDTRARWGLHLGRAKAADAWVFQCLDTHTIVESRDAVFHEDLSWPQ